MDSRERKELSISHEELLEIALGINTAMSRGETVFTHIDTLRRLPRPIVVDFNNVLANNENPVIPNPYGAKFLEKLRMTGTIIIVTTARHWQRVHDLLSLGGMWQEGDILLVEENWRFVDSRRVGFETRLMPEVEKIVSEYVKRFGHYKDTDFIEPSGYKRVAPLFMRPYEIPIVDDLRQATQGNPGMKGFLSLVFEPSDPGFTQYVNSQDDRMTFDEIADEVAYHYEDIVE